MMGIRDRVRKCKDRLLEESYVIMSSVAFPTARIIRSFWALLRACTAFSSVKFGRIFISRVFPLLCQSSVMSRSESIICTLQNYTISQLL